MSLTQVARCGSVLFMTQEPVLHTPGEVAKLCRVDAATVRRWIATGRLPATRLPGGTWRVHPADIDTLLARTEPQSVDPSDEAVSA